MKHFLQRIQIGDLSHHTHPDIPYPKVDREDSELEELELELGEEDSDHVLLCTFLVIQ